MDTLEVLYPADQDCPKRLGYVFEKFPRFDQPFCAREVLGLKSLGVDVKVFSIRRPSRIYQPLSSLLETTYLPDSFSAILEKDNFFRREARQAQRRLRHLWGDDSEKHRVYEAIWLKRETQRQNLPHLHAHFAGMAARAAFWARELGGPTYSLTAHANDIFCDDANRRLEMVFNQAEAIVTVSEFSANYLRQHFPQAAGKIHRVYNGLPLNAFTRSSFPRESPLVVAIGRLIQKKGLEDLIHACSLLADRNFTCEIIGEGPLREKLGDLICDLQLGGKVRMLGALDEPKIVAKLAQAWVLALPCVHAEDGGLDNLPTVIMEAMAAGIPVVSTKLAGIPELVLDGVTGWLVEEHNIPSLAQKISALLDNREVAQKMGEAGWRHCQQHFDIQKTSARLLDVIFKNIRTVDG